MILPLEIYGEEIKEKIDKIYENTSDLDPTQYIDVENFSQEWAKKNDIELGTAVQLHEKGMSVYGEVSIFGAETLLMYFGDAMWSDSAVFYDLGCGAGKLCCHVATRTDVKKVCGIEYSKERYEAALQIRDRVEYDNATPEFIHGDILDQDLSDATVVYVDNTGMPPKLLEKITHMLPAGCLLIYKSGGWRNGDNFFPLLTTYNQAVWIDPDDRGSDMEASLSMPLWWQRNVSWRVISETAEYDPSIVDNLRREPYRDTLIAPEDKSED